MAGSQADREDARLRAAVAAVHAGDRSPPRREAVGATSLPVARRAAKGWHQLSPEERQDVAQDALTKVVPRYLTGPPPRAERAPQYLRRAVRNRAQDVWELAYRTKEGTVRPLDGEAPRRAWDRAEYAELSAPTTAWCVAPTRGALDRALDREAAEAIHTAIDELPDSYRRAIHARIVEGRSLAELAEEEAERVAAEQGIDRAQLHAADVQKAYERSRKLAQRALRRLQALLAERGVGP